MTAMLNKWTVVAAAGVFATAAWYWFSLDESGKTSVALTATAPSHKQAAALAPLPAREQATSAAPEPLQALVERLARSGNPQDAYHAYYLIYRCVSLQRYGEYPTWKPASLRALTASGCEALSERVKANRLDYLERAAAGHVPGAAYALVQEGPFGDPSALTTRPDDPLVKEWKARMSTMLTERAAEGEKESLQKLHNANMFNETVVSVSDLQALTYGLALRTLYIQDGLPADELLPVSESMLSVIKARLTPQQFAQATTDATEILRKSAEHKQ
ncbi:hypothetical protein AB4Z19_25290 [Pseudoduganella sp. RAF19]|uniref:hypothetical protein n=1 Tax=Pseudoduganella sp. RAF19 TaxID=3233052 RepID=UPI003F95D4CD